jgi:hypothetical protein
VNPAGPRPLTETNILISRGFMDFNHIWHVLCPGGIARHALESNPMTPRPHHRRPGTAYQGHKSGLLYTTLIAATVCVTASTPARAAPIDYMLEDATALFNPAQADLITGTFTFDASHSPPTLSNVNIDCGGPPGITLCSPTHFVGSFPSSVNPDTIGVISLTARILEIVFATPLTANTIIDPIVEVSFFNDPMAIPSSTMDVSGCAVPVSHQEIVHCVSPQPAPEPTSLALLSGAVGLLLLRLRGRQAKQDRIACH